MFSLLLAVGWTNDVSAQLLPEYEVRAEGVLDNIETKTDAPTVRSSVHSHSLKGQSPSMFRAPRRSSQAASPVVHTRSWYEDFSYTWYEGNTSHPANLTDIADNPDQMIYLTQYVYKTKELPGILFSDGQNREVAYPSIVGKGYTGLTGTSYVNNLITLTSSNVLINSIVVRNARTDGTIVSWTGGNLPSGWTSSKTLQSRSISSGWTSTTWYYMDGGGTITILPR